MRRVRQLCLLLCLLATGVPLALPEEGWRPWRAPDMLVLSALEMLMESLKTLLRGPKGVKTELDWLEEVKMEMESHFGISKVEILTCNDTRIVAQAGPSLGGANCVLFSKGVLELLPQEEVIAVLAHEMTHVARLGSRAL